MMGGFIPWSREDRQERAQQSQQPVAMSAAQLPAVGFVAPKPAPTPMTARQQLRKALGAFGVAKVHRVHLWDQHVLHGLDTSKRLTEKVAQCWRETWAKVPRQAQRSIKAVWGLATPYEGLPIAPFFGLSAALASGPDQIAMTMSDGSVLNASSFAMKRLPTLHIRNVLAHEFAHLARAGNGVCMSAQTEQGTDFVVESWGFPISETREHIARRRAVAMSASANVARLLDPSEFYDQLRDALAENRRTK